MTRLLTGLFIGAALTLAAICAAPDIPDVDMEKVRMEAQKRAEKEVKP